MQYFQGAKQSYLKELLSAEKRTYLTQFYLKKPVPGHVKIVFPKRRHQNWILSKIIHPWLGRSVRLLKNEMELSSSLLRLTSICKPFWLHYQTIYAPLCMRKRVDHEGSFAGFKMAVRFLTTDKKSQRRQRRQCCWSQHWDESVKREFSF